jgi:hypothetical protein
MPSIIYGGLRYTQTRHAIQCKICLDTIESKHRHDFKMCSCGSVGIDGGIDDGNRILGEPSDIEDRGMYCAILQTKKIWLPPDLIQHVPHRLMTKVVDQSKDNRVCQSDQHLRSTRGESHENTGSQDKE